jgi:FAD:protein FMN transferase
VRVTEHDARRCALRGARGPGITIDVAWAWLIVLLLGAGCQTPPHDELPSTAAMTSRGALPPDPSRLEFTAVHMGMPVRIVLHATSDAAASRDRAAAAAASAFARIAALEDVLSDWRVHSELRVLERRANAAPGAWVPVGDELFAVLGVALDIARRTDGAFDPTVGPLVALWREARATGVVPGDVALDSARARVGWRLVELDDRREIAAGTTGPAVRFAREGVRLDLGGVAKGWILQDALRVLREAGVPSALIEAGGDIVAGEAPPGRAGWRVAVPGVPDHATSPDSGFAARVRSLANAALATSGDAAQFIEVDGVRRSHVIDPRTGLGVTHGCAAHVIVERRKDDAHAHHAGSAWGAGGGTYAAAGAYAATADALATALGVAAGADGTRIRAAFPEARVVLHGCQAVRR